MTRDIVISISGAVVPVALSTRATFRTSSSGHTRPETTNAFSLVSVLDAFPTVLEVFTVRISVCYIL